MSLADCHDLSIFLRSAERARRVRMATREQKEPEEARPAADLLPAIYDELRRLAAALTRQLRPVHGFRSG
jgi:hypothetical protein